MLVDIVCPGLSLPASLSLAGHWSQIEFPPILWKCLSGSSTSFIGDIHRRWQARMWHPARPSDAAFAESFDKDREVSCRLVVGLSIWRQPAQALRPFSRHTRVAPGTSLVGDDAAACPRNAQTVRSHSANPHQALVESNGAASRVAVTWWRRPPGSRRSRGLPTSPMTAICRVLETVSSSGNRKSLSG